MGLIDCDITRSAPRKKSLSKYIRLLLPYAIIAALFVSGSGCQRDIGEPPLASGPQTAESMGCITGVVTDNETHLPKETMPQTYQGASISVCRAVVSGTYKTSVESPEQTSYTIGGEVARFSSGEGGEFQIEVEAGMYFIRAFYGERSYSGDMLVEVKAGNTTNITLKLIHGI